MERNRLQGRFQMRICVEPGNIMAIYVNKSHQFTQCTCMGQCFPKAGTLSGSQYMYIEVHICNCHCPRNIISSDRVSQIHSAHNQENYMFWKQEKHEDVELCVCVMMFYR